MDVDNHTDYEARVRAWLDMYAQAWQSRDAALAARLFTENARYQEDPFAAPMYGQAAIYNYWSEQTSNQGDIRFSYTPLALTQGHVIVRWQASFRRISTGMLCELDGVALIELNDDMLCTTFHEWWHRREHASS
jgi:ketosteroid isomerase-like protein